MAHSLSRYARQVQNLLPVEVDGKKPSYCYCLAQVQKHWEAVREVPWSEKAAMIFRRMSDPCATVAEG